MHHHKEVAMSQSSVAIIKEANRVLIDEGNLDAVDQYFTTDYVAHLTDTDMTCNHAALQKILRAIYRAFSDIQVQVEILVKYKDRIAWQRTFKAIHTGNFKGFPATDSPIVWRDMVTSRISDGLIAEEWVITDLAERLLLLAKKQR